MAFVKAYYSTGPEDQTLSKTYAHFESMSNPQRSTNFLQPSTKHKTINLAKVIDIVNTVHPLGQSPPLPPPPCQPVIGCHRFP